MSAFFAASLHFRTCRKWDDLTLSLSSTLLMSQPLPEFTTLLVGQLWPTLTFSIAHPKCQEVFVWFWTLANSFSVQYIGRYVLVSGTANCLYCYFLAMLCMSMGVSLSASSYAGPDSLFFLSFSWFDLVSAGSSVLFLHLSSNHSMMQKWYSLPCPLKLLFRLVRCYTVFRTNLKMNEDEGIDSYGKNWICCDALYVSNLDGEGDKILFHPFVST